MKTKWARDGRRHVLLAHETIIEGHFREIFNRHRTILLQGISVRDSTCDVSWEVDSQRGGKNLRLKGRTDQLRGRPCWMHLPGGA